MMPFAVSKGHLFQKIADFPLFLDCCYFFLARLSLCCIDTPKRK
ncbi:hypothetical protein HMPREF9534_01967 [Escherichia coli MS 69-1]|nr:hypothetical protein HMPREF9534_01967 [Escherichia coli MS 69-1]ESD86809.1 hypothetical protein HMPREF1611_01935 [Escherichia coli 908573]